jgi:hypothetical protein
MSVHMVVVRQLAVGCVDRERERARDNNLRITTVSCRLVVMQCSPEVDENVLESMRYFGVIVLLLLLLFTAIEFSRGGNRP